MISLLLLLFWSNYYIISHHITSHILHNLPPNILALIWFDVMWCDVIWYDVIWYDVMIGPKQEKKKGDHRLERSNIDKENYFCLTIPCACCFNTTYYYVSYTTRTYHFTIVLNYYSTLCQVYLTERERKRETHTHTHEQVTPHKWYANNTN